MDLPKKKLRKMTVRNTTCGVLEYGKSKKVKDLNLLSYSHLIHSGNNFLHTIINGRNAAVFFQII